MTVPCNCSDTELCETGQRLTETRERANNGYQASIEQDGVGKQRLYDEFERCTNLLEAHLERAPYFRSLAKSSAE